MLSQWNKLEAEDDEIANTFPDRTGLASSYISSLLPPSIFPPSSSKPDRPHQFQQLHQLHKNKSQITKCTTTHTNTNINQHSDQEVIHNTSIRLSLPL